MVKIIDKTESNTLIQAILEGKIVSFPTETVYGAASRIDEESLQKLMEVKGREASKAITIMLSHKEDISSFGEVDDRILRVIDTFMPGSITIVLKKKDSVDAYITSGLDTVGLRIPDDPFVLDVIDKTGPLFVTSANQSGGHNTTTHEEVLKQINVDVVVKGHTNGTTASTVVSLVDGVKVLREGMIPSKKIEEVYYEGSNRV